MTALDTRDVAHQTTTSVLRKLRREVQDIRESWGIPATRRGMLATTLILVGSFSPASLPNQNPFRSVPVIGSMQYWPGMALAATLTIVGAFLLLDSWLRLRPSAAHRPTTRGTLWLWVLPLLLAPPLLSFDSYSYAAQGAMVSQGLNPYTDGPGLLDGDYRLQVDPLWQYTPAPYGPLSLQLQHLLVDVSGHNAYLSAVLMRIPATIGVGLIAVYLPRLARKLGYDRETTIWLAVLNPLVVLHLVGGAHNDSLMIGLMVLALWVAVERHLMWAAVAVAAAASVKQPAAAAIIAVAALTVWRTKGEKPTNAEVLRALVPATAVFAVAFAAISLVSGLGFGWVKAMGVPNTVRSMLSPFTMVGTGFEWLLQRDGVLRHRRGGGAVPAADEPAAGGPGHRLAAVEVQGQPTRTHPRVGPARVRHQQPGGAPVVPAVGRADLRDDRVGAKGPAMGHLGDGRHGHLQHRRCRLTQLCPLGRGHRCRRAHLAGHRARP